jgi:hypothetical protein
MQIDPSGTVAALGDSGARWVAGSGDQGTPFRSVGFHRATVECVHYKVGELVAEHFQEKFPAALEFGVDTDEVTLGKDPPQSGCHPAAEFYPGPQIEVGYLPEIGPGCESSTPIVHGQSFLMLVAGPFGSMHVRYSTG